MENAVPQLFVMDCLCDGNANLSGKSFVSISGNLLVGKIITVRSSGQAGTRFRFRFVSLEIVALDSSTEIGQSRCTWFGEFCSCCCLPTAFTQPEASTLAYP